MSTSRRQQRSTPETATPPIRHIVSNTLLSLVIGPARYNGRQLPTMASHNPCVSMVYLCRRRIRRRLVNHYCERCMWPSIAPEADYRRLGRIDLDVCHT